VAYYKVWIQVEKQFDDEDESKDPENASEPHELFSSANCDDATNAMHAIENLVQCLRSTE